MIADHEYPALALNADFRPLSYYPLSLWPWQEATKAVFLDRVAVVSEYDQTVHSPNFEFRLPSVIVLKDFVELDRTPSFTRMNIYARDRFTCAYCGLKKNTRDLTFDHVLPRSKGGRTSWENIVTACQPCNTKKAAKTPSEAGMKLLAEPRAPTVRELNENGTAMPKRYLYKDWVDYLYWDSVLEE